MRNKQDKMELMIKHITSYYHSHKRIEIPTMTMYTFDELCNVMLIFEMHDQLDEILSS